MTFCLVLGTLLGVVSLVLGAQWYRGRGRWAWPMGLTQGPGDGEAGGTLCDASPWLALSFLVTALCLVPSGLSCGGFSVTHNWVSEKCASSRGKLWQKELRVWKVRQQWI